jgi:PhoPQ-activated pathogenicity-related protein
MISQTWRSAADVNIPQWHHWVGVYVPDILVFSTAFLLIDGGSNTSAAPANSPADLGLVALASGSVVVQLKTVPNEPVIFTDETISRSEDAIIAYTFDKYIEHLGEPGNETWPLLLPMVNSAVRAMDTIQDFVPDVVEGAQIDDFVVFGGSKRGWTTWLTAAVDDRVRAIMPGVIDVLNIPAQMVHHYNVYGFFAEAIQDYEDLQLFERQLTTESRELYRIVDPYRYLTNGRFDDMPKLIANSSGDQFFVSDAGQFYLDDLPGELNRVRYFPNSSHGINDSPAVLQARLDSIISFYGAVLFGVPLPEYSWTVAQDGSIHVQAQTHPTTVKLWQATNLDARDFRRHFWPDIQWTSTVLPDQGGDNYIGDVSMPSPQGATGYFVELTFDSPIPQLPPFVFTTEIRVKSTFSLTPWPFDPGSPEPSAVPATLAAAASAPLAIDDPVRGAVSMALAMQGDEATLSDDIAAPVVILAAEQPPSSGSDSAPAGMMLSEAPAVEEAGEADIDPEAVDALFGSALDELLD